MSTPNPTHIITEGMREVATEGQKGTPGTREDGQLWGAFPNTMTIKDLAAHVVSKLTDAGYSIMPAESAWTLSRAQSLAFGTERMDSGDVEYSRGYNTAVDCFRDVLRVADVEGEKP